MSQKKKPARKRKPTLTLDVVEARLRTLGDSVAHNHRNIVDVAQAARDDMRVIKGNLEMIGDTVKTLQQRVQEMAEIPLEVEVDRTAPVDPAAQRKEVIERAKKRHEENLAKVANATIDPAAYWKSVSARYPKQAEMILETVNQAAAHDAFGDVDVTPVCDSEDMNPQAAEAEERDARRKAQAMQAMQAMQEMSDAAFKHQRDREREDLLATAGRMWVRECGKHHSACAIVPSMQVQDTGIAIQCGSCCRSSMFYSFDGIRDEQAKEAVRNIRGFTQRAGTPEQQAKDLADDLERFMKEAPSRVPSELERESKLPRFELPTAFERQDGQSRAIVLAGYAELAAVLDEALQQAQAGKGKERHAGPREAFVDQQIVQLCEWMGSIQGGVFQACKKALEAVRLSYPRGRIELLGAINYMAAMVILLDRMAVRENEQPPF